MKDINMIINVNFTGWMWEKEMVFLLMLGVVFFMQLILFFRKWSIVLSRGQEEELQKEEEHAESEGVSVIITSHNEADSLRKNLMGFLMQQYPKYEVIVVDECSEDETEEVLAAYQQEYPHLKCTKIHPDTKFRFTKKLAINIGILSAQYEILLFSEAYCYPASSSWLTSMKKKFDEKTAVVLGLANYSAEAYPDFRGSGLRFFKLQRFMEMLRLGARKKHILGDGCNMGYRKSYYIKNRGFAGNAQSYLGYDTDMVNGLSKYGKVKVDKNKKTYMWINQPGNSDSVHDISYYYAGKSKWPIGVRMGLGLDKTLWLVMLVLLVLAGCYGVPFYWLLIPPMLLLLGDVSLTAYFADKLGQRNLFMASLFSHVAGFVFRWYWNGYSFFNQKKWR